MKNIVILLSFLLVTLCVSAQKEKLTNFAKGKQDKIKVGMSVAEVKAIYSNPKSIDGGFPSSGELVLKTLPEQRGQMNYSTWFYMYSPMTILYDDPNSAAFLINGSRLTEADYNAYEGKEEAYSIDDRIISEAVAEGYKITGNKNLKKVPIISRKFVSAKKVNTTFLPVLCVIFEKGTVSVTDSRMYFLIQ